ncbi:MAG TPA: hypothetical protein VGP71_15075 [Burkholderiales bacterium]|jgi:hypothetical protein|nr:hypothetical protein [Burkholderiales bacterium]
MLRRAIGALLVACSGALYGAPVRTEHVEAELVAARGGRCGQPDSRRAAAADDPERPLGASGSHAIEIDVPIKY